MGLRSGLPNLGPPRRCVADLAAPIQLAPAAQQSKIKSAHQPPRSYRGQPVEAPHLANIQKAQRWAGPESVRSKGLGVRSHIGLIEGLVPFRSTPYGPYGRLGPSLNQGSPEAPARHPPAESGRPRPGP